MDQSDTVTMGDYGVYRCRWYIRHHEDYAKRPITECHFQPEIREIQQDGTLGNMWTMRPLRVNHFLKKLRGYVCGTNMTYTWPRIGWLGHSNIEQQEERN